MHSEYLALAGIIAALTVGVVSPGPSFVMIARTAVASSRREALGAAVGMGLGGLLFGAAALAGLQAVLSAVPGVYVALKVLGGLYLCTLGVQIFRGARQPLRLDTSAPTNAKATRAMLLGFVTQVSNPKTAVVYASVFAAFLPASTSAFFVVALLALVFAVEAGWYGLVALLLSAERPQRAYLACKATVDRAAGTVMCGLGLKLVLDGGTR